MSGNKMYLAQNIKYLREHKCEMQKDIADLLSVSKQTASVYEKGEIEPDIAKLIMLADHFEVTIDDLIRKDLRPAKPMCADNLKYLRKKYEMDQEEMAHLLKTSKSNISKYENGSVRLSIEQIMKVSEYFGFTLDQFVKQDLSEVSK